MDFKTNNINEIEIIDELNTELTDVIYTKDMMDYEINVYGTKEEPYFLLEDIGNWLECNSHFTHLSKLVDADDMINLNVLLETGKTKNKLFVTEDGLYEICMRSNLPKAKNVRKFIKKLLREIRQNTETRNALTEINTNNFSQMATILATALQPLQQSVINMQKENNAFRASIIEEQNQLSAKTKAIENTLNFLRIDHYEKQSIADAMSHKRNNYRDYFDTLGKKYDVSPSRISRVWDYYIYQDMYKYIGREKITLYTDKSRHTNQNINDITKAEYPKCIDFIKAYTLDKIKFNEVIENNYGSRRK